MRSTATIGLLLTLLMGGCGSSSANPVPAAHTMLSLDQISKAEWESLASQRIFFGHQSVGRNIIDGVREILDERPEISLHLVKTDQPASVEGPALIEADLGTNGDPQSKADHFALVLDRGFGETGGIAMYKYCYVDVTADTDVEQLFQHYTSQTEELRARYPNVRIVHVTLPLRTAKWTGAKEQLKTLLGRPTEIALNAKRSRFNELLRQKYGERDPLFDLAQIQSTRPDGSPSYVRYGPTKVPMLAPEWTYDRGHFNEEGRRMVAERFLVFLAKLSGNEAANSRTVAAG